MVRPRNRHRTPIARRPTAFQPNVECLESRIVLDYTVSFAGDTLSIIGDAGQDNILEVNFNTGSNSVTFRELQSGINFNFAGGNIPADVTGNGTRTLTVSANYFTNPAHKVSFDLADALTNNDVRIVTTEPLPQNISISSAAAQGRLFGSTGDDVVQMVSQLNSSNFTLNGSIAFSGFDVFNGGDGTDRVLGKSGFNDAIRVTGVESLTAFSITFTDVEAYNARAGNNDTVIIEVTNTPLTYTALNNLNQAGNILGIDFSEIEDVNSPSTSPITIVGADQVNLFADNIVNVDGTRVNDVVAVQNTGTVVATAGADAINVTGVDEITINMIVFTGVGTFDGGGAVDTVSLIRNAPVTFTFTPGAPANTFSADNIDFVSIEAVTASGQDVTIDSANTVTIFGNGLLNANSISFVNVVAVRNVEFVNGNNSQGDFFSIIGDRAFVTSDIAFENISTVNGGGGVDTLALIVNDPEFDIDFQFGNTPSQFMSNNMNFLSFEALNTESANVRLLNVDTLLVATEQSQRVRVNGLQIENVVSATNVNQVIGSNSDDAFRATGPNQLLFNGTFFDNVSTVNGGGGVDSLLVGNGVDPVTIDFNLNQDLTSTANALFNSGITFTSLEAVENQDAGGNNLGIALENVPLLIVTGDRSVTANGIAFENVTGGNNIDTVQGTASDSLNGITGDDLFTLLTPTSVRINSLEFTEVDVLFGGTGNDTVVGPAGMGGWTLTQDSLGIFTFNILTAPGDGLSVINGDNLSDNLRSRLIENVVSGLADGTDTIFGTEESDQFLFSVADITLASGDTIRVQRLNTLVLEGFQLVSGLAGNDSFIMGQDAVFAGNLDGGDGIDLLTGDNDGNHFIIHGTAGNEIREQRTAFALGNENLGLSKLRDPNDPNTIFTFRNIEGVNGGTGDDELDYRATGFAGISFNAQGQVIPANLINDVNRGDILNMRNFQFPVQVQADLGLVRSMIDTLVVSNVETFFGTNFDDRFSRTASSPNAIRVYVGGPGHDYYQTRNGVTDVMIVDSADTLGPIDLTGTNRDFVVFTDGPIPIPNVVFSPQTPFPGTVNLFQIFSSTQQGGFINVNNIELVGEAYVRYLYRVLIGGDPDSAAGQRVVSDWTNRITTQSLNTFDLVRAFVRQDVDSSTPGIQDFYTHFFSGFANRSYGNPFAGLSAAALAAQVRAGVDLEVVAFNAGLRVSEQALAEAWSEESLVHILGDVQTNVLRELGSAAPLIGETPTSTVRTFTDTIFANLRVLNRKWLFTVEAFMNSPLALSAAIRMATLEDPVAYVDLFNSAGQRSLKLGSTEQVDGALIWFLDSPPLTRGTGPSQISYGLANDTPTPGDWNNDGTEDLGVFRNGFWFLDTNFSIGFQGTDTSVLFGIPTDIPTPGDFTGDGRTNLGVFRRGIWYLDTNRVFGWQGNDTAIQFGVPIDIPIVGDWDGDGIDNMGVVRGNTFHLDTNGVFGWQGNDTTIVDTFGIVPGVSKFLVHDFNADGRDDIAVINGNVWRIDIAGPLGFQAGLDVEIEFDTNGGTPIAMVTQGLFLSRLVAGSTADAPMSLAPTGLDLLTVSRTAAPTANNSAAGSTTPPVVSPFSSTTTTSATTLNEPSRPSQGTGNPLILAVTEDDEWLLDEAIVDGAGHQEDAVDQALLDWVNAV